MTQTATQDRQNQLLNRMWLTAVLAVMVIFWSSMCHARANILILNAYHQGYKWSDDIMAGIVAELNTLSPRPRLYVEYMDTKRMSGQLFDRQLARLYQLKYTGRPPDVVIATDNNAFEFLKTFGSDLFGHAPVVFCGLNYFKPGDIAGLNNFTGVNEQADLKTSLDLALKLHPDTQRVFIINDRTPTGLRVAARLQSIIPDYRQQKFIWLGDRAMDDIITQVSQLKKGDIVFYTFFFRDARGRFFEYDEGISRIAAVSPVPIYGAWDFNLGFGIVGGMLASGRFQGQTAAKLAKRILKGESPSDIPVVTRSPNHFMFDYVQMTRYGIDEGDLPPDSIVINRPDAFYRTNKQLVWGTLAAIIALHFIIFALVLNILRRKTAEARIKKSQRRFNTILTTANEGFWETDAAGLIVDVNPEMTAIMGRSRRQVLGKPIEAFFQLDLADGQGPERLAVAELTTRCTFEVQIQRPDRRPAHCLFNVTPLLDENRGITGAFAMVTDITDIRAAESALQNSEAILRATFDATEDGLLVISPEGRVTHRNQQFVNIWQVPTALDNLGQARPIIDHLRASSRQAHLIDRLAQLDSSATEGPYIIRIAGNRIVESYASPLVLDGQVAGRIISFRDITAKRQMETQLIQAQKMEAIGNLAGGIAHDFNNRLQAISGYSQLLLMDQPGDGPDQERLRAIQRAVKRSCELTEQLLMFSRKIESRLEPVDLNEEVRQVKRLLGRTIPRAIDIKLKLAQNLATVSGDAAQIEQVVMNLGINASHAMPSGGQLTISTADVHLDSDFCRQHMPLTAGDYIRLTVTDTGSGMDADTAERIFEPFFTTKPPGKGTGLGLAMVHGIIRNHFGQIICHSTPGQGTRFDLYFPALAAGDRRQEGRPGTVMELPSGSETVLVVDDEPDNLNIARTILERVGYRVFTAASGQQALTLHQDRRCRPDLTILDLDMPERNGRQVLDDLLGIRPDAIILMASGYGADAAVQGAVDSGAAGYIKKPYNLADLVTTVRRILDAPRPQTAANATGTAKPSKTEPALSASAES